MRPIQRHGKPKILEEKEEKWLEVFLRSGNDRPSSSKYGNQNIRKILNNMSHTKCYYCETVLKNEPKEVDHFVEVAKDKNKAFEWENLYLACSNCNRSKKPDDRISVKSVIDSCNTSQKEIEQHLTFDSHQIYQNNASVKGKDTIQKFNLDSELLDHLRAEELRKFTEQLLKIRQAQVEQKRSYYSRNELAFLLSFAYPQKPYSYMFRLLFKLERLKKL